jgi:hypothetical protein
MKTMKAMKEVDKMIMRALNECREDRENNCATMGTLSAFQVLAPDPFAKPLTAIANLADCEDRNTPSLQILVGSGRNFATKCKLHPCFEAMLKEFVQSESQHLECVDVGQSLTVVGLNHHTAAAASFVMEPDGIFVNAMAVANCRHSGACELTTLLHCSQMEFNHPRISHILVAPQA